MWEMEEEDMATAEHQISRTLGSALNFRCLNWNGFAEFSSTLQWGVVRIDARLTMIREEF
jgi:hypothetical protein